MAMDSEIVSDAILASGLPKEIVDACKAIAEEKGTNNKDLAEFIWEEIIKKLVPALAEGIIDHIKSNAEISLDNLVDPGSLKDSLGGAVVNDPAGTNSTIPDSII